MPGLWARSPIGDTQEACLSHAPPLGTWLTIQAYALTGNRTGDPLVCRLALNPLSNTSQGSTRFAQQWFSRTPCVPPTFVSPFYLPWDPLHKVSTQNFSKTLLQCLSHMCFSVFSVSPLYSIHGMCKEGSTGDSGLTTFTLVFRTASLAGYDRIFLDGTNL